MTSLTSSLVTKTFHDLEHATSVYKHIPEEDLKGAFPDPRTRNPDDLYGRFGLAAYKFTEASAALNYYRQLLPIMLEELEKTKDVKEDKFDPRALLIISGLVCGRLGYAECGESNLVTIANFYQDREYDGLLLDCSLYSGANPSDTHCFSILVPRRDSSKVLLDRTLTFGELKVNVPDSLLIDPYFREAGRLADVESACPQFCNYRRWLRNCKFGVDEIFDSSNPKLKSISSKIEQVASMYFRHLKGLPRPECPALTRIETLYRRDVKTVLSTFTMKASGHCLFSYATTTELRLACAKLDRLQVEFVVNPPLPEIAEGGESADLSHCLVVYPEVEFNLRG